MSKYKGMTSYGVTTKDIKEYASDHNLNPTDVWKKVIDKFVKNGATEYEGYTENCEDYYAENWEKYRDCYVTSKNETLHYDSGRGITIISVKELLEENEDDWYTNGKLPPVGTKCIVNWNYPLPEEKIIQQSINGKTVEIIAHDIVYDHVNVAVLKSKQYDHYIYYALAADSFIPIPEENTELEVLTEKCTELFSASFSSVVIKMMANKLYEGGFRVGVLDKDA